MIIFFFNIYIKVVLVIIFFPLSIIINFFKLRQNNNHNFIKKNYTKYFRIFKFKFYSPLSFFIFLFLFPFIKLLKLSNLQLFKPKKIIIRQTPKQVASLVAYRVLNNLKLINKISDIHKTKYIFILQPLLLASSISTDLDKKLIQHIANQKYDGFTYEIYCKEFYNFLKESIIQDKELGDKFKDFSKIFSNINEQRFVDPVHFGNIGQYECAKLISQIIMDNEKKLKQ